MEIVVQVRGLDAQRMRNYQLSAPDMVLPDDIQEEAVGNMPSAQQATTNRQGVGTINSARGHKRRTDEFMHRRKAASASTVEELRNIAAEQMATSESQLLGRIDLTNPKV